jgi:hypothetical protein
LIINYKQKNQKQNQNQRNMEKICRHFMDGKCEHQNCKFSHDKAVCKEYWKTGKCKFGEKCRNKHIKNTFKKKNQRNTQCFEPMTKPVDMRVVIDIGFDRLRNTRKQHLDIPLTSRDVLLCPNLFSEFSPNEIYDRLVNEISNCNVPEEELLKWWHGNEVVSGTHFIINDKTKWREYSPTFKMVIERIKNYFEMDIKATRFNWYKDTSQWKPFHKDAAAVKQDKSNTQNFTVAVSFGISRDCAFERDDQCKNVVSFPVGDGEIYCFANDTNIIWRHGVLQDKPVQERGRISVIAWGWKANIQS